MAAKSPRGAITPDDLANLPPAQRDKLLERNPELAEALREPAPAKQPRRLEPVPNPPKAPEAAAPRPAGQKATRAAKTAATDRPSPRRRGAGRRRRAPARRLASRVARETPGVPGPSVTNLLLAFAGTTVLVIGLTVLLEGGERVSFIPMSVGKFIARVADPADTLDHVKKP